jgi:hypothetical protein
MAKTFFQKLEQVSPYEIKAIQTDNGKEHYKHFHNYIQERNIKHFWNYPKNLSNVFSRISIVVRKRECLENNTPPT